MANVTFDATAGTYKATAPSDSQPFGGYEVSFDPMTDEFRCECPAFTYSRDRHCKHISRVGGIITDYVDSLDNETVFESTFRGPETTDEEARFEVSLNEGAFKVLDAGTVAWLLETVGSGDKLELLRL